jgi:hypothetical protein
LFSNEEIPMSRTQKPNGQTGLVAPEAKSAEITTASVTIKTLRVNGRPLTLGTFRRLPRRDLIDEDKVELLGGVWGWVNYNPDGGPHERQFVVQFGEELCRCPVTIRDLSRSNESQWTADYVERWNALMDRLRTAPQLFIAT